MENIEFMAHLTNILRNASASHGILNIYFLNTHPQIHMTDTQFLQFFPSYNEEPWDAGTFNTKLYTKLNGVEVFALTNLLPGEK